MSVGLAVRVAVVEVAVLVELATVEVTDPEVDFALDALEALEALDVAVPVVLFTEALVLATVDLVVAVEATVEDADLVEAVLLVVAVVVEDASKASQTPASQRPAASCSASVQSSKQVSHSAAKPS